MIEFFKLFGSKTAKIKMLELQVAALQAEIKALRGKKRYPRKGRKVVMNAENK